MRLKQVGLAFRIFSGDNGDKFPMQLTVTNGGFLERLPQVSASDIFRVMSNELVATKIVVCPTDRGRQPAADFGPRFTNRNVSYFVCLEANEVRPEVVLAGDRNFTNGLATTNRVLTITSNTTVGWTDEIHYRAGNLGLSDGSVQQVLNGQRVQQYIHESLRSHFAATTNATLRLAMPE